MPLRTPVVSVHGLGRWAGAMTNTSDSRPALAIDGADLLSASVWAGPSYILVRLTGEWDVTASDQLRDLLAAQVRAGARNLVVDLSDVAFLDLACLYALLDGARMAGRAGGTLQLTSPQSVIVRLISLLGAGPLITVRTSLAEATAG
jgi:anti-sigma B factor antagonist